MSPTQASQVFASGAVCVWHWPTGPAVRCDPMHDHDALVTTCERICMHRKRVKISGVLAGQRLGVREVDEGIWLVSFMS